MEIHSSVLKKLVPRGIYRNARDGNVQTYKGCTITLIRENVFTVEGSEEAKNNFWNAERMPTYVGREWWRTTSISAIEKSNNNLRKNGFTQNEFGCWVKDIYIP
jgi:hypothetical protein